jgi:hypothetical protein
LVWIASIIPVFIGCFLLRKLATLLTALFKTPAKHS